MLLQMNSNSLVIKQKQQSNKQPNEIQEDWVSKLNFKIEFFVLYNRHQNCLDKSLKGDTDSEMQEHLLVWNNSFELIWNHQTMMLESIVTCCWKKNPQFCVFNCVLIFSTWSNWYKTSWYKIYLARTEWKTISLLRFRRFV